jgi:hypothetical protein
MGKNGRTDHFTDHARNTNVIGAMMCKMIRNALLFPPPLQAYFPLKGPAIMLTREQNTLLRKGHL